MILEPNLHTYKPKDVVFAYVLTAALTPPEKPLLERLWSVRGAFLFCVALGLFILPRAAFAQLQLGRIQGTVTHQENGKPLNGVTVVISGPALQSDQTAVTDTGGFFQITQLPPGDNYIARFYFNDVVVERQGIRITQGKTFNVSPSMPTAKGRHDSYVVKERAPNVDTASSNTGAEINQELLRNTAVRGRTYESAMSLAPGASDVAPKGHAGGEVGTSFGGGTGNENLFVIDGLNTTDLAYGLLSTQLNHNFIKDIQVITGGYQAEYGRVTGGIVSVLTNTGSNEFHGSVFGSWAPYQAPAQTVARLGEALASRSGQLHQYDFGFELGGPIVKDRVWFYVGFAPTTTILRGERIVRTHRATTDGAGALIPARDSNYRPPSYLSSPELYAGLDKLALETTERSSQQDSELARLYNWIAKLQININPDHNITLGYIGSPEFRTEFNDLRSDLEGQKIERISQVHDVSAHYVGKVLDRALQFDVIYGYHYQGLREMPQDADAASIVYRASASDPFSLADFENVPECARQGSFNPCPITSYTKDGLGQFKPLQLLQRHAIQASMTYFMKMLGTHALKLGFDFEDNLSDNTRKYTGPDLDPSDPASAFFKGRYVYQTDASGTGLRINRGFALPTPSNLFGETGVPCGSGLYCYNSFRAITETRNYALYLRDSWDISAIGLVINAGVRWESQELFGADGSRQIGLYKNLAPRIGAIWDPSRKGRGKLYANYGRYYQLTPMDMNNRAFSGEGLLVGRDSFATDCGTERYSQYGRDVPVPVRGAGKPCSLGNPSLSGGGIYAPVAPSLHGQFVNEVVVGGEIDVGLDIVIGAYYSYRDLGNIIEDISVDDGNTFFVANPGASSDPATLTRLEIEARQAHQRADAAPADTQLAADALAAERLSQMYKAVETFPRARRVYHAGTLTVQKRFSHRFSLLANYTYSRLFGNYPGSFDPYTNQLDPNVSAQFDTIGLTVNRDGPLNNDRPHNVKVTGFYVQPLFSGRGSLTTSLTFTGISGRPIQTLGQHGMYGARQTFILPSGTAGRTPFVWQLDLHIGYEHEISKGVKASIYGDILNATNNREVINVDDEYTFSIVDPILNGKPESLRGLRASNGSQIVLNSNYGQPTAFQAPLSLRFGGRISF